MTARKISPRDSACRTSIGAENGSAAGVLEQIGGEFLRLPGSAPKTFTHGARPAGAMEQ